MTCRTASASSSPQALPIGQPTVSVVIATVGRTSLVRAVRSALTQTAPPLEVLVVADGGTPLPAALPAHPTVRVLHASGRAGPAGARMLGVREARGDLIAFLDDDDLWLPGKLAAQVREYLRLASTAEHVVVGCRSINVSAAGAVLGTVPRRLPAPGEDLADYLFRRREVRPGATALGTSVLLCDRSLLRLEPWDERLDRHEDWEWLLRVSRRGDVAFTMIDEALIHYLVQPAGASASGAPGWQTSLSWVEGVGRQLTRRQVGDFLLCVTAPIAVVHGQRRAALSIARTAFVRGRPGPQACVFFALSLLAPARSLSWVRRVWGWRKGSGHTHSTLASRTERLTPR
jgi:GT2 family glycosyltransferase